MSDPLIPCNPGDPNDARRSSLDAVISESTFWKPLWSQPSAWSEHVPFAFWLVEATKPRVLVELGTHYGISYMAFCQSVQSHGLGTKCFAVDTWEGDPQAGQYGENVFAGVSAHNEQHYASFSTLLRETFDEALARFADGSIDLLHIDGLHTYEAVKHDFEGWLPKMSARGVVVFHDTAEKERDFGVYKLWEEIAKKWLSFEFFHGHGLGVLGTGSELPEKLVPLFEASARVSFAEEIRACYSALGRGVQLEWNHKKLSATVWDLQARLKRSQESEQERKAELRKAVAAHESTSKKLTQTLGELESNACELKWKAAELADNAARHSKTKDELACAIQDQKRLNADLALIRASFGWRAQSWLRYLGRLCTSRKEASFLVFRASVFLGISKKKRELRRQARQITRLGLVDVAWYRNRYEPLAGAFVSPVLHYLRSGVKQECDPNPLFDTKWYCKKYAEKTKGANPLLHYIRKGASKGCNPSPSFNSKAYLDRRPDLRSAGVNPLSHYLKRIARRGTPATAHAPSPSNGKPRVVYVSLSVFYPGHVYRVEMYANALAKRGYEVQVIPAKEIPRSIELLESASVIVLWRTEWSEEVARIFSIAKRTGAKVIFDIDDLLFEPELANAKVIDAIRFRKLDEAQLADSYGRMRKSALAAHYCTASTEPLASALRQLRKPTFLLPNGYDEKTYLVTRRAVAERQAEARDGLIRLGYAGGTPTHQKDFGCAAPAIARILRERPECRLILFRSENALCLDPSEYPDFVGLEAQIEWQPFVPLRALPNAIARFDINLAPIEHGNPFCEAKSELKYFEAALANVPTVASPTVPFANSIRHGETGFLAKNNEEWYEHLLRLVCDPQLRSQTGKAAFDDVYWRSGPERRAELIDNVIEQILHGCDRAANAFRLELFRREAPGLPAARIPENDVLFESGLRSVSSVAVVVSLFNYGNFVEEALESVKSQTLANKDLIVVDDCSTDDSASIVQAWLEQNAVFFPHVALLKNKVNSGLDLTRNAGFSHTDAPFVMVLDADNLLEPKCLERCLAEITRTGAAAAYPLIRKFGNDDKVIGTRDWSPIHFATSNYIDAMAMVRRSAWARVGGFQRVAVKGGWQDYDFWCRFVELGLWAYWVKEVLALYRVHGNSMLHTSTDLPGIKEDLVEQMRTRHPWIDLPMKAPSDRTQA